MIYRVEIIPIKIPSDYSVAMQNTPNSKNNNGKSKGPEPQALEQRNNVKTNPISLQDNISKALCGTGDQTDGQISETQQEN